MTANTPIEEKHESENHGGDQGDVLAEAEGILIQHNEYDGLDDDDLISHYSKRIPLLNPDADKSKLKVVENDIIAEQE